MDKKSILGGQKECYYSLEGIQKIYGKKRLDKNQITQLFDIRAISY